MANFKQTFTWVGNTRACLAQIVSRLAQAQRIQAGLATENPALIPFTFQGAGYYANFPQVIADVQLWASYELQAQSAKQMVSIPSGPPAIAARLHPEGRLANVGTVEAAEEAVAIAGTLKPTEDPPEPPKAA
jgi:hypothetical protein